MSTRKDPLDSDLPRDRVFFATGMMLDAEDFLAEQGYHRGRLARGLAFVDGTGTAAGLRVGYRLRPGDPTAVDTGPTEELIVGAGLALDRQGRLIEEPGDVCLRLDRWYSKQAQSTDHAVVGALAEAWHTQAEHGIAGAAWDGVVADVFIRYAACEQGKTPAFATGPFDALDAVQPSRIRDGYDVYLVLRPEDNLPQRIPAEWPVFNPGDDAATRRRKLQDAILDGWPGNANTPPAPPQFDEHPETEPDRLGVFLARIVIKADKPVGDAAPVRAPLPAPDPTPHGATDDQAADSVVKIDNHLRLFVYMPQALVRATL